MSKSIEFLRNQENEYTASPNYCIQEKCLITGIDPDYTDQIGWFDTDGGYMASEEEAISLQAGYDDDGTIPDGWIRTGYDRQWRYTGVNFLTHAEAHAYVAGQGRRRHEYPIRVYVDSHWRNAEMKEVRRLLAGPVHDCIKALQAMIEEDDGGMAATQAKAALAYLDTALEPHQ